MADQFEQCFNKADNFAGLGQYADAIASYDKAIAINQDYPLARQNREIALRKM
jgi:tetratricopeptide (TPR) repeat protein